MEGIDVARLLLKTAAANGAGRVLGKVLLGGAHAAKSTVQAAGTFGQGVAEGLGAGQGGRILGKRLGQTAALGAGYVGAKKGKRKVDEFRYRHGLYDQY